MGLGSKSPFAYTDTFTAVSRHKGMRYSFSCSLDNGAPNITQYPSVPMEPGEETGLEVEFPVNAGDYSAFQNKLKYFALFFCGELKFVIEPGMRESYQYDWSNPTKANLEYVHNVAISDELRSRGIHVLMGGVLYDCDAPEFSPKNFPLTRDQFSDVMHALTNCGSCGFVIKGELGCVDIAASREHCELTAKTVNYVLTVLHNYLEHVEKDFLEELDKLKLDDYEYCSRYAEFLKTKPFLSSAKLNKKIEDCFNLCAYTDAEMQTKRNTTPGTDQDNWTVMWTAPNGTKRDKELLMFMPRTLTTGAPRGSELRYGSSKLRAVSAVAKGHIKFLQVPEDRKSASLPPQTFAKFPSTAEVIMIRDNKQCDYLRSRNIEVIRAEDLPKPERKQMAVGSAASDKDRVKVVKSDAQRLLRNYRVAFPNAQGYDFHYRGEIDNVTNLGLMTSSRTPFYSASELDKLITEDRLVLLPVTSSTSSSKEFYAHISWLRDKLKPAVKFQMATDTIRYNFQAMLSWLQRHDYRVLIKEFAISASADVIQQDLADTCKALGCTDPVELLTKAVKAHAPSPMEFLREQQIFMLRAYFSLQVLSNTELRTSLNAAILGCTLTQGERKVLSSLLSVDPTEGHAADIVIGEWLYNGDNCTKTVMLSNFGRSAEVPNTEYCSGICTLLKKVDDELHKSYPLIRRVCSWEQSFPRALYQTVSSGSGETDSVVSYLEAMLAYNKKAKKAATSQN